MNKLKNKVTLLNTALSLTLQIVSVVSGLIIPRLVLSTFGSNTNGLVASINQYLNYIALIEGGVTGVVSASLYKPLVNKDWNKVSSVLATARSFYRKIAIIFIVYTILVGLVYPLVVDTGYNYLYIFVLTCVLSVGLLLQYMFSLTMTTLLNADKKVYVVSLISIILTIGNIVLVVLVLKYYPDIIILKAASAVLFALKPIVLSAYIKKHYNLNWSVSKDKNLLKQRWNGFAINLAFFIHISTDVTILTLMQDLKVVSVYNVYSLIVTNISVLIHSIASGIEPTIGQAYAKGNQKELNEKIDLYEFIVFFSVGILFSLTAVLITPFVLLYTKGVTDANYNQPVFGFLLVVAEAVYLIKYPHLTLSYSANKFKDIKTHAYIEAIINIVVSLALVRYLGLVGVACGTIAGMLYRMIFHVYYSTKLIPGRKQIIYYKKLLVFAVVSFASVVLCSILFPINDVSFVTWIIHAIIYGLIICMLFLVSALLFYKKELKYFYCYLKQK